MTLSASDLLIQTQIDAIRIRQLARWTQDARDTRGAELTPLKEQALVYQWSLEFRRRQAIARLGEL